MKYISIVLLPMLLLGCVGMPAVQTPVQAARGNNNTQSQTVNQTVVNINNDSKNSMEDVRSILRSDMEMQNQALDGIKEFCEKEIPIDGGFFATAPAKLNLRGFDVVRVQYPKEYAALDEKQRQNLIKYYARLEQINSLLTSRSDVSVSLSQTKISRIHTLDAAILLEITAAKSIDFSWLK